MDRTPKPGEFYRHFKNKLYQIVAVARHSETGEALVIYQALYGDFGIYARPLEMFIGEVDHEKYPNVTARYRFERVKPKAGMEISAAPAMADADCWETMPVSEETDVKAPEADAPGIPEEPNAWMMNFLEAETFEQQMGALKKMERHVGQKELDSLYVVLDMKPQDGTVEDQIRAIRSYLQMQDHFDGNRLR